MRDILRFSDILDLIGVYPSENRSCVKGLRHVAVSSHVETVSLGVIF